MTPTATTIPSTQAAARIAIRNALAVTDRSGTARSTASVVASANIVAVWPLG